MIKRLVFAGAVTVLAIGCANSGKDVSSQSSGETGSTYVYDSAGDTALPAQAVTTEHSGKSYTVVSGDSLWKIARNHGTTVEKLKAANSLTGEMIHPGQVLVIP